MTTFPDGRWGSDTSILRQPLIALASTKPGSWLIKTLTPLDRKLLIRSRGRYTVLGPIGAPVLLLTTTGVTSGLPRTTPLLFAREGDSVIVVGSNFGQDKHPAWTGNLIAEPTAVVTLGGKDIPAVAEHLSGDDAEAGYRALIEVAQTYAEYRSRTDRDIRVFRLSRR
jgi:deazaflavin-dependent oxidoreductase (nitroreductase family)